MIDWERECAKIIAKETGIKTVLEVPENRPEEFISLELVGTDGAMFNPKYSFAIQSWAKTRIRAAEISRMVELAVYELDENEALFSPGVDGTYRFPDPDSRQERYQTTIHVTVCE